MFCPWESLSQRICNIQIRVYFANLYNHQRDLKIHNVSHLFNDELVIVWTFNVITKSFCLVIFYLSEIRSSVSIITSSILLPTSTLYSFRDITSSWASHVLASDVNVISPRGPRVYLSVIRMDKSHSWSRASTNNFRVPNYTFIVTLLRCDVWWNQSTLSVLVIYVISWSKD